MCNNYCAKKHYLDYEKVYKPLMEGLNGPSVHGMQIVKK